MQPCGLIAHGVLPPIRPPGALSGQAMCVVLRHIGKILLLFIAEIAYLTKLKVFDAVSAALRAFSQLRLLSSLVP
jgi:hypothetical protein